MSYQVLARKWRPQTFQDMVGQQHVLQALVNALQQQRLHHAYLFTGTRGVGKTTIARIFAKSLNCEQGITATPCGQCGNCTAIEQGRFVDLIEVDAASRTSVEDTRELLNNVQYAANTGRFKVYLIDEVHMLSGHSFNALLKTLEEPPEHVKFLLATTDPQKLPVTVLSRCLQFHLKNMLPEQITEHLQTVLKAEKIDYELSALQSLARAAQGSMRDALSLLDQAIAFANGKLTTSIISQMLGTIEQTHIQQMLDALVSNDAAALFQFTEQFAEQGLNFSSILEDLLTALHQIALSQAIPDALPSDEPNAAVMSHIAQHISREDVQLWYQIALIGRRDLSLAPSDKVGLEMILLRMLAFQPAKANDAESKPKKVTVAKTEEAKLAPPQTTTLKTLDWTNTVSQLNLSGLTQALANHCSLETQQGNHIELQLAENFKPLFSESRQQQIADALSQQLGHTIQVTIKIGSSENATPAQVAEHDRQTKQQAAVDAINTDPQVQLLREQFDATVIEDSIKSNC